MLKHLGKKIAVRKQASEYSQEINSTEKMKNVKAGRPGRELLTACGCVRSRWLGKGGWVILEKCRRAPISLKLKKKNEGCARRRHSQRTIWLSSAQYLQSRSNVNIDSDVIKTDTC